MKTRILYLCHSLEIGGAEKVLVDVLENLDYNKFELRVLMLLNQNAYEEVTSKLPISVYSIKMNSVTPRTLYDILKILSIYKIIKDYGPDIIHTQGSNADLYGQIIGTLLNIKIVTTIHGVDVFRYNKYSAKKKYRIKMFLENYTIRTCSKIIVVSNSVKKYCIAYRNIRKDKIVIIRNSIARLERSSANIISKSLYYGNSDIKIIGTVCRIAPEKNLYLAIDAFVILHNKMPQSIFIIVGDGDEKKSLQNYAEKLGVGNAVVFAGFTKNVQSYYEMFDIFVIASYVEGLPLTLLEAMSLDIPVISTDVGGISELIEDEFSGLLIKSAGGGHLAKVISNEEYHDVSSREKIAEAMERLLLNPELSHMLAKNAHETFEKECSLDANVKKLEQLYESMLKR